MLDPLSQDAAALLHEAFDESASVKQAFIEAQAGEMLRAVALVVECFRCSGKVLLAGNGGSASDAQQVRFQRSDLKSIGFSRVASALKAVSRAVHRRARPTAFFANPCRVDRVA